jgi:hypothetical protein
MNTDVLIRNWEMADSREKCARFFNVQIKKLFMYLAKNIVDRECLLKVCELKDKFNIACDTIYTYEQIVEKIGPVLQKWIEKIIKYDYEFFKQTNITILLTDACGKNISAAEKNINDETRVIFDRSLTQNMRIVIFDALNILLRLYARYNILTK